MRPRRELMEKPRAAHKAADKDVEVIEDGQEEVFSQTAVERGFVKDPPALGDTFPPGLGRQPC
jgi:hypothetical protein